MRKLRSENEIMANWQRIDQPLVSICCATYNHAAFIEDAIEGFLIQETDFSFEILIHDDASTDGTDKIIKEYGAEYPKLIKPIYQVENQCSKGLRPARLNYERAGGEYIAICEGDDYWLSPGKLQRQIELLESHDDVNLCFHPALKENLLNERREIIGRYRDGNGIVSVEEIVEKRFGQIPMASMVVRRRIIMEYLRFRDENGYLKVGDIYIQFFGAQPSGALFLNSVDSIYRYMTPGSWNRAQYSKFSVRQDNISARIRSYNALNRWTSHKYSKSFLHSNYLFLRSFIYSRNVPFKNRQSMFRRNRKSLSFRQKIVVFLGVLIPRFIINIKNYIRS